MNFEYLNPVGALTSKPYTFTSRPWEVEVVSSFDYYDSIMTPINFNIRDGAVVRVLPGSYTEWGRWISDKIRFSYDGFYKQRLGHPQIKVSNNFYKNLRWDAALRFWYLNILPCSNLNFGLGSKNDLIDQLVVSNFSSLLGFSKTNYFSESSSSIPQKMVSNNNYYELNLLFKSLEDLDCNSNFTILLVGGINLRYEFPTLNLLFRKLIKQNKLSVYTFGSIFGSNYQTFPYLSLGTTINDLVNFAFSRNFNLIELSSKTKFSILFSPNFLTRLDNSQIFSFLDSFSFRLSRFLNLKPDFKIKIMTLISDVSNSTGLFFASNNYNFSSTYKSSLLALDQNFVNCLIDSCNLTIAKLKKIDSFNIYCTSHYSDQFDYNYFDLILPTLLPWESKNQVFLNLFGNFRLNKSFSLQSFSPMSRKFFQIIKNLVYVIFKFNNLFNWLNKFFTSYLVFWFLKIWKFSLLFKNSQSYFCEYLGLSNFFFDNAIGAYVIPNLNEFKIINSKIFFTPLTSFYLNNFYQTDVVTKSSYLMAVSSSRFSNYNYNFLIFKNK